MGKLKQWPEGLKPREKALKLGIEALSDAELLALVLSSGTNGKNAVELASDLLVKSGSLKNLLSMPISSLMELEGIRLARACQLSAGRELARRVSLETAVKDGVSCPKEVISWLQKEIGYDSQEVVYALFLDVRNRIVSYGRIFQGGNDSVQFQNRELFQKALRFSAVKIILAHNHPSGSVFPSQADRVLTEQLREAGKMLNIEILDHLIISHNGYFSFREQGI
ncbi:MAG: DNA repair protein RadC [Erysipelotrichaceae bacterium]|nr:DNA repair protein RadC [Erysipelotrichaceae bacterium]